MNANRSPVPTHRRPWQSGELWQIDVPPDLERSKPRPYGTSFKLLFCLFLATFSVDAARKTVGLPTSTLGVVYVLTGITYSIFLVRAGHRSRVVPRSLPLWLTGLSLWCIVDAMIQKIPLGMALLGWVSYAFFVPLLYIGAELMADDDRAAKALRIVASAGGIVGVGAIISALLESSAPPILLPIVPGVGFHTFAEGNVYLAPSIFATGEEAAEILLIAFFAWIALAHMSAGRPGRSLSAVLGMLIVGGMIATVRRTDILVAGAGIITLLMLGRIHPSATIGRSSRKNRRGRRSRQGIALFLAVVASGFLISLLGANMLIPFLFSGGPSSRASLMFSLTNSGSILGQGTWTSTQGAALVGATLFYGLNSKGPYTAYLLNGRTFITAEGGLAKTWTELGGLGVILYGGVFLSALGPIARSLRRLASAIHRMIDECLGHASELRKHPQDAQFGPHPLGAGLRRRFRTSAALQRQDPDESRLDGAGRALTILTLALGVVFLKGHQDLDNPLVQPLFWLAAGGAWGRMRALADLYTGSEKHLPRRLAIPRRSPISGPQADLI
jgi:hypothetical protein